MNATPVANVTMDVQITSDVDLKALYSPSHAIDVVRKAGKVVAFGLNLTAVAQFQQFQITGKELDVLGAWLANATFPSAVKILESGALDIAGLISHRIPLDEIHHGLDLLSNRKALKIVVNP